ncbi:MAG: magnesium transporter [Phycisphaerae bacterium]|jgi:magnesium transporter|nr:MAG: magnesium transporter [Phycisphaerae bacterium]
MKLANGRLEAVEDVKAARVAIYSSPTPEERELLQKECNLDIHDINSALDPDEVARLEFEHTWLFLILKRPKSLSNTGGRLSFGVVTEGIVIQPDRFTVIQPDDHSLFEDRKARTYNSGNEILIRHLQQTVSHFLGHLRAIKMVSAELEVKLAHSMENKYFLQMFSLSESLVYYIDALSANLGVFRKIAAISDKLGFSEQEKEMFDDLVVDQQQCLRQAEIYQTVLNGLMDARGNIINNNMNVLLKNLTIINIVFLPLNLLAGMGGMSEFTMMTESVHWSVSYSLFTLAMIVIGFVLWWILNKVISRNRSS